MDHLAGRYVLVNIPDYRLSVVESGSEVFTSRVIVGKEQRATPILASEHAPPANDNVADAAPLAVLKSLIARADFAVTNDTGPRHIAAAFNVPGVVLAGPMDPRYGASGQGRLTVLREEVSCAPCNLPRCPIDHRCMTRIKPETVARAGLDFLTK